MRQGAGIDREMRPAGEPLIDPDRVEFVPIGERNALGDRQFCPTGHLSVLLRRWDHPGATSRIVIASAWARGTIVSIRHHSSSRWALPPTGPVPHKVGVPSAAVKPLSAEPPVASP